MSIVKKSSATVQNLSGALANLRQDKKTLAALAGTWLLLDVSGSMAEHIGERRKIDHLRAALTAYPLIPRIAFSDLCQEGSIPEPRGGTDLALALRVLWQRHPTHVVLISDGEPDNEEAALRDARALQCPISVVFIGQPGSRGEAFMQRLCAATGGRQQTAQPQADLGQQLTQAVRGLLPQASAKEEKMT